MKKVLIIVPYLYDGGAERVASLWANYLAEDDNFEVHLLNYYKLEKEYYLSPRVTRHSFFEHESEYKMHKFLRLIIDSRRIKKVVKEVKPDVVLPFSHVTCICTSIACKHQKTQVYHTIRNNPWLEPGSKWIRVLRDHYIKKDKKLIVQNDEQLEYFTGFKSLEKYIVYNPINDKCLEFSKAKYGEIKKIIAVGRLAPQKNYFVMLEAMKKVLENKRDVTLDIYGDGFIKDEITNKIKELGLESNVTLKGNSQNVYERLVESDLFLMTSDFEGFPNALLEAMALGVPAISTDCKTGPKDLIKHNETGLLAKTGDPSDIAEKILQLLNNPKHAQTLAENAKKDCLNRFSKQNVKNQLKKIIL